MKRNFNWKTTIFLLFCFFLPFFCLAASIKVSPAVISQQVLARDFLEFTINVKNQSSRPVRLYAVVNDISMQEGKQEFLDPSQMSRPESLARWVKISRGQMNLEAGEERNVPLSVDVPPDAEVAKRYAVVAFSQGSNREEAESKAQKLNQPQVLLDIEVKENIIERAQINEFSAEKSLFFGFPIKLSLEIENIGDQEIRPRGQIYIYDRKGEELGAVPVNNNLAAVSPLGKQVFENIWDAEKGFGRYKARLVAEYGREERKLQDTIYFWVLPWRFLFILGGGFSVVVIILSTFILRGKQRKYSEKEEPSISTIDIRSSGKKR